MTINPQGFGQCPYHLSQPVIEGTGQVAIFITLTINPTDAAYAQVRDFCAGFTGLVKSMRVRDTQKQFHAIIGFGDAAWQRLYPEAKPRHLHPFQETKGQKHTAPSTPGDLFFHLRAGSMDVCFEFARLIMMQLQGAVKKEDEVHGFRSFDGRSMVGFVDGTENPVGVEACEWAFIGDEDPAFKGGSYVIVQRYEHDLTAWNQLTVEEQEKVMGRTKFDDIELSDDEKPINAHNAVTNISDEQGNELKIVRENLPFGDASSGVFGTYFIGYAKDPAITERMIHNMFIGEPEGNYDRLLDFSTARTGTLFFIPSYEQLDALSEEGEEE